jgi:hypothetical protein
VSVIAAGIGVVATGARLRAQTEPAVMTELEPAVEAEPEAEAA